LPHIQHPQHDYANLIRDAVCVIQLINRIYIDVLCVHNAEGHSIFRFPKILASKLYPLAKSINACKAITKNQNHKTTKFSNIECYSIELLIFKTSKMITMKYKIDLYTRVKIDTSSDAKAYANMLCIDDQCKTFAEGFVENSQSRISLMAIVNGLEQIKVGAEVTIYVTSKYVKNTFEKGWVLNWKYNDWLKADGEPPLNVDLWMRFAVQMQRHKLTFEYVSNYKKYPQLVECREIGAAILLQPNLQIDEV
jgi:ribonuclease HI